MPRNFQTRHITSLQHIPVTPQMREELESHTVMQPLKVYLGSFAQCSLAGHGLVTHLNDLDVMLHRYTSDNTAHRAATGGSSKGGGYDHAGPDAHS